MKASSNLSLSLCSGAGGLDFGLEAAGWQTVAQIEMDKDCVGTLQSMAKRRRRKPIIFDDALENISPANLRRKLRLRKGELGLLAGGPPCQPFTTHGLRQGISDARASSIFPHYLAYVKEFLPNAIVLENVDGFLSAALQHRPLIGRTKDAPLLPAEMKGSFLKWLVFELARLGYSVSWGVLEAADYGVPQFRQRAFLIGIHDGDTCYLPSPNTSNNPTTLRQTLKHIPDPGPVQPLSPRKKEIYRLIPPGGNWRHLSIALQKKTMGAAFYADGGKGGWWRRLSWDDPSPTILGMPDHSSTGLIHPDEVRCLGINECAAIQTFPEGHKFLGSPRSQYQQIGNAVPPILAKVVGSHILKHLGGKRSSRPTPPLWRKASANRRIGTHGWITPTSRGPKAELNVKIREDHIWSR